MNITIFIGKLELKLFSETIYSDWDFAWHLIIQLRSQRSMKPKKRAQILEDFQRMALKNIQTQMHQMIDSNMANSLQLFVCWLVELVVQLHFIYVRNDLEFHEVERVLIDFHV